MCIIVIYWSYRSYFINEARYDQNENVYNSVLGDVITLVSAFMYGLYATLLKAKVPQDDRFSMTLFLGFLGL